MSVVLGKTDGKELEEGLTFDDILLLPGESKVLPKDVDVTVSLTPEIRLNIPLLTAAMDTVTEADTAIAIAREGGIGVVHRNNTADEQAVEVDRVKKSESGMIIDPITVDPDQRVHEALDVMNKYRISGLPVTRSGKLVGILTNRDLRFETNFDQPISSVMTLAGRGGAKEAVIRVATINPGAAIKALAAKGYTVRDSWRG